MPGANSSSERSLLGRCSHNTHKRALLQQLPEGAGATRIAWCLFSFPLQPVIFLPNAFGTDFNIPSPAASPPPAYDNVAYIPKEPSE